MADRVTQLQDAVNQLADLFCNSVGILQQSLESKEKLPVSDEKKRVDGATAEGGKDEELSAKNIDLFTSLITRTAQDIDVLIESLPRSDYKAEMQVDELRKLDSENRRLAEKLEDLTSEGDSILSDIGATLRDIHNTQLKIQQI